MHPPPLVLKEGSVLWGESTHALWDGALHGGEG